MTAKEQEVVDAMEPIVTEAINKLDPIGLLALGSPADEYAQAIRGVTLRLWMAKDHFLKLAEIMYVVFAFTFDLDDAKPEGKYFYAANEVMEKYKEWKDGRTRKEISQVVSET